MPHMEKNEAHCSKYWDSLNAKGEKCASFQDYLTEMSWQTSHGGALETKAIATK